MKTATKFLVFVLLIVVKLCYAQQSGNIPDFVYSVRTGSCQSSDYSNFQFPHMKTMGINYIHGHECFSWQLIQPYETVWKWNLSDSIMDLISANNMKLIISILTPKLPYLHYNNSIYRDDTAYINAYKTFVYNVTNRYKNHPAWSGMMSVWGGSSDVMVDSASQYWLDPERHVPLLNAAYDGAKMADSTTIVISFNMASSTAISSEWEEWHQRAFLLNPRFDYFGVNTHMKKATIHDTTFFYGGAMGLKSIRQFLDSNGFSSKPMFVSEGGFIYGEDIEGFSEDLHAEQTILNYIVSRTLPIELKGWVYFSYFSPTHTGDDFDWGLLGACDQTDSLQPRLTWFALKTLFKEIQFEDYNFESQISGITNQSQPFKYKFSHKTLPNSYLWTVFSPWWMTIDSTNGKPVFHSPINRIDTINISPFSQVTQVSFTGNSQTLIADSNGNVVVSSTDSVLYLLCNPPTTITHKEMSKNSVVVCPNPFKDYIDIDIQTKASIEILNFQGQVLHFANNINSKTTINLPELKSGIYIIKIKTNDDIFVNKLIKQ